QQTISGADHHVALRAVLETLKEAQLDEVGAVGHRIVHGGEKFRRPQLVDPEVKSQIREVFELAPLHNPAGLHGIDIVEELLPGMPQVVVFDTAFHQTWLPEVYRYAIPEEYYKRWRIRRYGFHGISNQYVTKEVSIRLGRPADQLHLVLCHLGNGCSATAVREGQSVDNTMGLTPLEGLMMGTRSGNVDPNLHLVLSEKEGLSLPEIIQLLTTRSGLLGVSGVSHDLREVIKAADEGNKSAQLAINLFSHRLAKGVLELTAGLARVDAIAFSGGIGEHSAQIRSLTVDRLAIVHAQLDPRRNEQHGKETNGLISPDNSLPIFVIATNEELLIAQETLKLTSSSVDPT
ncbi:MAG: acetate/propionate family kinase, partial [Verrucomicrobia bacterium]|nr:acetate/propionate family kinase [Verrucomicrobiota bacterium]